MPSWPSWLILEGSMRARLVGAAVIAGGVVLLAAPVLAHHSWQAEYDPKKVVTLKGVVSKIEWTNPHVRIYVDVKDDKGGVVNWDLELQSVNTLTRAGWDRNVLKVGDGLTVDAWVARDGSQRGNARENITLADGRKIFAGERARGADEEISR
jgi:hypothetical protein